MDLSHALPIAALAASAFLLFFAARARIPAAFATAASGLEVLFSTGVIRLQSRFPISLLLGAVLLVAGAIAYRRVTAKGAVSAATVAALVGLIQVLQGLRGP